MGRFRSLATSPVPSAINQQMSKPISNQQSSISNSMPWHNPVQGFPQQLLIGDC
jgi:hypothetical protein